MTKLFTVKCHSCGDQNPLDNDKMSSVWIYFQEGSPNTFDRLIVYCKNCGNKEEVVAAKEDRLRDDSSWIEGRE